MGLTRTEWWDKAVDFHGHSCPGLALGVRIALDFRDEIGLDRRAGDEELVAVVETDACGVDGIQVILNCTAGEGNLWLRARGKHVFTLYERASGRGLRYSWRARVKSDEMDRPGKIDFFRHGPREELYDLEPARQPLPPRAPSYVSHPCGRCGELTAEPNLRVREGRMLCLECAGLPFDLSRRILL